MPLHTKEIVPILALSALYIAGFVLPSFKLAPNFARKYFGPNALAVGAAIKFFPVFLLGVKLLTRATRAATGKAEKFAFLIGVGLVFGSIGDLLLDFADAFPITFLLGLASFLVGHLFYCWAFAQDQLNFKPLVISAFVAVPAVLLRILWPHLPSDMVVPVIIYGITLASMGLLSASRKNVSPKSYLFALLGSIVFIASDSILAIDRFRQKLPYGKLAVMLTYYTAQILIAKAGAEAVAADVKGARGKARAASLSPLKIEKAVEERVASSTPAKALAAAVASPARGRASSVSKNNKSAAKKAITEASPAKAKASVATVASSAKKAVGSAVEKVISSAKKSVASKSKSPARSKTPAKATASASVARRKKAEKKSPAPAAASSRSSKSPAAKKPARSATGGAAGKKK